MSIISSIRKRSRLLVGVIGVSLFFFIAQELARVQGGLFKKVPVIGLLSGKKIQIKEFEAQLEKLKNGYVRIYGLSPSEEQMIYLRQSAWEKIINDRIYSELCESIGIQVSPAELIDMVQGEHIHPDIQATFTSPKTKTFSKEDLLYTLSNISQLPRETQVQWYEDEQSLAKQRCQEKFQQLMEHSVFVTTLSAQQAWMLDNTLLDIEYISIPYTQLPAKDEKIKWQTMEFYIRAHKDEYSVAENKEIKYIKFPIVPSETDILAFDQELDELHQAFIQTKEDKIFATTHTDMASDSVTLQCTQATLPAELLSYKDQLKKGSVIGPMEDKHQSYKIYKVSNIILGKDKQYDFTVIEKKIPYSDTTKELFYKKAEAFIKNVKTHKQFDDYAKKNGLTPEHAKVYREDINIGSLRQVRPLVLWLYNQEKVGKRSPIFEIEDQYIVAIIVNHTPEGVIPLEQVSEEVNRSMENEAQAELFIEHLRSLNLSSASLQEIAMHYKDQAEYHKAEKIRFNSTYLPGIGPVKQAIHSVFALDVGERSNVIGERNDIMLLSVINRSTPPLPDSWKTQQNHQKMLEQYKQASVLFKALTQPLQLEDYRYKYY